MPRPIRIPARPHYLAALRKIMGLTQEQLAGALGVSRPLLTRVEAGQRYLPGKAQLPLSWLVQALPPPEPAAPSRPVAPTAPGPAEQAPLQARAEAIAHELLLLGRRLGRGEGYIRRARSFLRVAPQLQATLSATGELQRRWLALTTAEAEYTLAGEGRPGQQQLLTARQAGLQAEAAVLAAYLAPPAPG